MNKKVYVVIGLDLGWDCLVGVFDKESTNQKELFELFPHPEYYIYEKTVENDFKEY